MSIINIRKTRQQVLSDLGDIARISLEKRIAIELDITFEQSNRDGFSSIYTDND
jgi:hypothetical protein